MSRDRACSRSNGNQGHASRTLAGSHLHFSLHAGHVTLPRILHNVATDHSGLTPNNCLSASTLKNSRKDLFAVLGQVSTPGSNDCRAGRVWVVMNDWPESPVHFCSADEQQLPFHCSISWCHCHSFSLFLFFFPLRPVSQHLSFITAFIKLAVQSFPRQQFSESPSNPPLPIPSLWFLLLIK